MDWLRRIFADFRPRRVVIRVIRVRLPGDQSFLYLRVAREQRRVNVHAEWIPRRYWSPKRVEVMTFREEV
jgi:hypothetical protein